MLIRQPLLAGLPPGQSKRVILLVDALDECDMEDRAKLVLYVFRSYRDLGLKLFITSRPEEPVRLGFASIRGKYQDIVLQEIPEALIRRDLALYFRSELDKIRRDWGVLMPEEGHLAHNWPEPSQVQYLVDMAIPLFIFAATICRFLAEFRFGNPGERLREMLPYQTLSQKSGIDKTYRPVLQNLTAGLSSKMEDRVLQQFRSIVGSIVILVSPLSTRSLSRILRIDQGIIDGQLRMLHSVLSVPQSAKAPVRLLHLSFRDYLVNSENKGQNPFWVDEEKTHLELATRCLQLMMELLRKDMCGLEQMGVFDSNIDQEQVESYIPAEVQYACLHWVFQFQGARALKRDFDFEQIHVFLKQRFLYWIEALCVMRRISDSIYMIQSLRSLLLVSPTVLKHVLEASHANPTNVLRGYRADLGESSMILSTTRDDFSVTTGSSSNKRLCSFTARHSSLRQNAASFADGSRKICLVGSAGYQRYRNNGAHFCRSWRAKNIF